MHTLKSLSLAAVSAAVFAYSAPQAHAQDFTDAAEPGCPYGYYDCAPYGYYGPEWFVGGIFIGAGPWFRGHEGGFGGGHEGGHR